MNPDILLFHVLNGFSGSNAVLDSLIRMIVNDYLVPTAMAIALVGIWVSGSNAEEKRRNQRTVIFTLVAFGLTLAIVKDIWNVYYRPRPFAMEHVKLLFYRPSVSSFPSLPIAIAFCFAAGARRASLRIGGLLYTLGAMYALARVYAGVHYPLDVMAGAIIGVGTVKVIVKLEFVSNMFADWVIVLARRFYLM